ncbi:Protein of unknown function [Gryllus bimaculatus]|nr:Protein of unknown function [Gryllus bimaculatus]
MGFVAQAGALFLTAVLLHSLSMGQGEAGRSYQTIRPGSRPCGQFCPAVVEPVSLGDSQRSMSLQKPCSSPPSLNNFFVEH